MAKQKHNSAARWAAEQAARNPKPPASPGDPFSADERAYREQHGKIDRVRKLDVGITDEVGYTFRSVDTVAAMHKAGTIDDAMFAAARRFRDDFDRGHLEALRSADYSRAVVDCRMPSDPHQHGEAARNRIWKALGVIGGLKGRQGSAVWHVVGLGDSLTEWSTWGGGRLSYERPVEKWPMHKLTAAGILTAALETLAQHYGFKKTA